jgi:transglutaminase-like putative cysteine protease
MASRELPVSVALAALSASVALSLGAIFASTAWVTPLLVAAVVPHAVGFVVRRVTPSGAVSAVAGVVGLLVAADLWAGSPAAITDQLRSMWTIVQNDTVPLPATHATILAAGIIVFAVGLIADDLAFHRDGAMSALGPGLTVVIWVRVLAPRRGWVLSTIAFGVAAVAFLALQHQALLERRRTKVGRTMTGVRPLVFTGTVAAGVVAILVGAAFANVVPAPTHPLLGRVLPGGQPINNYQNSVGPLVDIGAQLKQGPREQLFTVVASQPDYWRITALDRYSGAGGGGWTLSATGGAVGQGLSGKAPRGALVQRYRIGPLGQRWMPAAYDPVSVSRSDTIVVKSSGTLVTNSKSVENLAYTVVSRLAPSSASPAQQLATNAPVPASLRQYTALPSDLPRVLVNTAQQVTAGRATPYDKAAALRDYFRSGRFTYDPNVDLTDAENAMVAFLNTRRGFCVQFASTYVVMARSLGIPARLAVGYTSGTAADGVYSVTNLDAHAWPEIWLSGLGWTHFFDPTPAVDRGGSALPSEPPPVTTPTPNASSTPATVPLSPTPAPVPTPAPHRVSVGGGPSSSGLSTLGWLLVILGLLAAGVVVSVLAAAARRRRRRVRRRSAADPAERVAGAWAEALDGFRAAGVGWPASLTPLEVAGRLPRQVDPKVGPPLDALAQRYTATRYGREPPTADLARAAWQDADAVLRALDDVLDLRARLRSRLRTPTG